MSQGRRLGVAYKIPCKLRRAREGLSYSRVGVGSSGMGTVPTQVIVYPSQVILSVTVILATETDSSYFE